jgi:hypothetical protein
MVKQSQRQTGSAHIVIIVILVLVILGALGFVYWQNFIRKDSVVEPMKTPSSSQATTKSVTYKTYTTDVYNVSFQYPDDWTLSDPVKSDDVDDVSRSITVTTSEGDKVGFVVGIRGIGGLCGDTSTYKVVDTSSTTIPGQKPVSFSFTLQPNGDGTYEGYYGLTDYYTSLGDIQSCPNTFHYLFSPTNNDYGLIEFDAKKSFADVDAANKYIATDAYKAIKKMITSLTY